MRHLVAGCNPVDERGRGGNPGRKSCLTLKRGKYHQWLFLLFSVTLSKPVRLVEAGNPHEPMLWKLINVVDSKVIQTRTGPGQWNFTVHLHSLITIPGSPETIKKQTQCKAFYVCPASNPGKLYCNYPGHFFCGYWGCETVASDWTPSPQDKNIKIEWGPPGCKKPKHGYDGTVQGSCGPSHTCWRIEIFIRNPEAKHWLVGKMWGIRFWEPGADRGSIFKIIKERIPHDPAPIGPNNDIKQPPQSPLTNIKSPNTSFQVGNLTSPKNRNGDPFWNLMQASYQALNKSRPNLTEDCWLCYSVKPPYYEAIGKTNKVQWSNGTNPRECSWSEQKNYTQGITIQSITGKGKCLGAVPEQYKFLCNSTITRHKIETKKNESNKWIIPTSGAKWVCSDIGLTPCLSIKVLDASQQFCVQVMVVPRLMYHTSEEIMNHFEGDLRVGAGTGVASIVKSTEIQKLQIAVDEDLGRIEQSIENLATSVKSLSEVVLKNRRGLDLLFLKEGGLCVALKEECCSFADHTGVVKDSMSELRKRLDQRKKDREMNKSWYEGWFSATPWLTTLLSALAGPLIIIILGLIGRLLTSSQSPPGGRKRPLSN
uniref:Uncharacterized protein n=2 Tax=Corvus moneduloides TaxID=1196302 RepID=A0A8C3DR59_CORMO